MSRLLLILSVSCFSSFFCGLHAQITFSRQTTHALSSMTTTIENNANGGGAWLTGDFDGDGDLDIVGRVAADNALAYWRNDGSTWTSLTGSLNPFNGITFTAGVNNFIFQNIAALDIDGDGDVDVYNGGVNEVYRNNGNGTFTKLTSHPLSSLTTTIDNASNGAGAWITGDFDSDGDLDIVGRVASDDALAYWRNDGSTWTSLTGTSNPFNGITFTAGITSFNSNNAAALDIDGDGDIDVYSGGVNEMYRNNGDGTFTKLTSHPLSSLTTTIENTSNGAGAWLTGDFDGDGDLDIAGRVAADNAIAYWRNNSDGTWSSLTGSSNPFNGITFTASISNFIWNNMAALDIDNDGDFDLFNSAVNEVYQASGAAPALTSSTPANLASAVPATNITLNFNENINAGTGNIYIRRLSDNVVVQTIAANSGNVTGSGTNTIVINPPADLATGTSYYITLDRTALADADGVIVGRISTLSNRRLPVSSSSFLSFSVLGTMPVSLLAFTAAETDGKVVLQWQTASEQNSRDFTIQYSSNGQSWEAIGKVMAAGQSNQLIDYSFTDTRSLQEVNYYRLLQTDIDGKEHLSAIRIIRLSNTPGFMLYPNPASSAVTLQLPAGRTTTVMIYNTQGKEVKRITDTGSTITLSLEGWAKGLYQVVMLQNGHRVSKQLMVQ